MLFDEVFFGTSHFTVKRIEVFKETVLTVVELHLHKPERTMLHGKVLDDLQEVKLWTEIKGENTVLFVTLNLFLRLMHF